MEIPGERTYPSRRDGWLTAILWFAVVDMAFSVAVVQRCPWSLLARGAFTVLMAAAAGLCLWVLYGTSYTFSGDRLLVRSGPFRWTVPLAEVEEVRPSHNVLSSPACSLDRLLVRYGRRRLLISPDDREGFMRELAARRPDLMVNGVRAWRREAGLEHSSARLGPA